MATKKQRKVETRHGGKDDQWKKWRSQGGEDKIGKIVHRTSHSAPIFPGIAM